MTLNINYTQTNSPVRSVEVVNPQGFANLTLTIDTVGGTRNPRTRRIDISNGTSSVKLAVGSIEDFIEALQLLEDYGVDASAVAA